MVVEVVVGKVFGFIGCKKEWCYAKEGLISVYPWFGTKTVAGLSWIVLVFFCLGWYKGLFWLIIFSSSLHETHLYLEGMKKEHEVFLGHGLWPLIYLGMIPTIGHKPITWYYKTKLSKVVRSTVLGVYCIGCRPANLRRKD